MQNPDQLRRRLLALLAVKEALEFGPGEEVGMNDLIGITAQDTIVYCIVRNSDRNRIIKRGRAAATLDLSL
jgi:hypothetical protein